MFYFLRSFFKGIQQLEPSIDSNIISYFVSDSRTISQNFSNNRRHFDKSFQTHIPFSQSQSLQSQKQTHYQKSNYKRHPKLKKTQKIQQNENKSQLMKAKQQENQFIQTKSNKILPADIQSQNEKNPIQETQNQFINHANCLENSSKGVFKTYSHQILSEALKEQSSRLQKSDRIFAWDNGDSLTGKKNNCKNSGQKDISELFLDDDRVYSCQSKQNNQQLSDDKSWEDQFFSIKRVYEQNRKQIKAQQRKSTNF